MKEKLDSCQSKLKRAEEKLKNLSQVEVECEVSAVEEIEIVKLITTALKSILKLVKLQSLVAKCCEI